MKTLKLNGAVYFVVRLFFLVLCFFSIFKGIFSFLFKTRVFEYFDEAAFFMALVVLVPIYFFKKKIYLIYFIIGSFILYSIVISLLFGVSGTVLTIVLQTLITVKFFIIVLALTELFKKEYNTLNRFFLWVVWFAIIGFAIHFLFGTKFNQWAGIPTFARPDIRYVGFFTHPNHLAYVMVLYSAYILNKNYKFSQPLKWMDWFKIAFSFFVIVLADSRTAMIGIAILLFIFYWKLIKKNYRLILGGMLIGFLSVIYTLLFTNLLDSVMRNINDTFNLESSYIRGNMIYLSALIFKDYFPIGTGAATFGSVLADNTVYALYGQANRYYFKKEIGIYDSNIASIVGEYGFMGILFFMAFFKYITKYLKGFSKNKTLVMPFILVFLIYSITNPMLTNNLYTLLTAVVLVLFVTTHQKITVAQ